jgi:D-sedoheptulose 7-phosphate isomerase
MKKANTKRRGSASGGPLERQAKVSLRVAATTMARLERSGARAVAAAAEAMIACLESGGTVFFCGNGGSAADAEHLACELSGRYLLDRPALAAIALTANTSALTAIGNDFGFDRVFARQLEGLGTPGDVLVALTTSGRSPNVLRAVEVARGLGMVVIGMTGPEGRRFAASCDHVLITPQQGTPRIQEGHILLGHVACALVERALFGARRPARRRAGTPGSARRPARGRPTGGSRRPR